MSEASPRILVADDREENRYVLCRILSQAGYDCTEAGTGSMALELAHSLPDLLILDVGLPDLSGYEVCRRIKHDPRTPQISILQISASFVSSDDRVRALEGGADGYLTHPIDAMVLLATVRALLRLRAAESVARKSADQWQSAFDALSEGLAMVDADGKLIRWNDAFAEMCLPHLDRGPVDAAEVLEKTLGAGEALRHCGTQRFQSEYTIDQRTIQLSLKQVDPENAAAGKILVLSDSTDRNLAEYALRTADKIAATARLAHAIAHEINNPLEALTNLLHLARTSSSMDSIQNLILQATAEVDRIARITRQTLSFHRDTQFPQVLDVGELVSDVASVLQNSATARHVRVECDCRPTLAINGFPGQLRQIFNNLIRNAAEAAPEGTAVVVRVRSISRGGRAGTRVTIHDRGRGIPAEVRRQIFDPFSTTKELKGSGLGLWVSRNLIMRHNGTIRFRTSTREGASGTIFEVFLPVGGMSSDGTPPGEQNAQPSFRSKRIQEWISAE